MLADFVLELVNAPGTGTITLPTGVTPPAGRLTWAAGFNNTRQPVIYILDDTVIEEWGIGTFIPGSPATITRDYVIRNSAGTKVKLDFTASSTRCYNGLPAGVLLACLSSNVGRNLLHNGMFRIAQRGAGAFTVAGYTADRWTAATGTAGGSRSITVQAASDADRTAIADEHATSFLQAVVTGGAAAGDYDAINQYIETVRRTSNKTVAVSFWAKAASGTPKIGVNLQQYYGAGGSPSTATWQTAQSVTLSTTWTRYTLIFDVPSTTGKTLGTAGDALILGLFLSSGATSNAVAGSIGVQNGTFSLWGLQLEIGPAPSALEKPDVEVELAECQRFYQKYTGVRIAGYTAVGGTLYLDFPLPVPMRATPTPAYSSQAYTNGNTFATDLASATHVRFSMQGTALGPAIGTADVTLSADL